MLEVLVKPTFVIAGAAKSGTTSIYHYLRKHPEVFMPSYEEPSYFCRDAAQLVTEEDKYFELFADAAQFKAIGEGSVNYLYDPTSAERIFEALGTIIILIFLRNPVDRAYSMWAHNVRQGYEQLSFQEALLEEESRISQLDCKINGTWAGSFAYVDRGRYSVQIQRFMRTFGKENVHIFIYEEFFREGLPGYADLCRYLGVSDDHVPKPKIHNRAGMPRSILLRELLRRKLWIKEPVKFFLPEGKRHSVRRFLYNLNQKKVNLPPMDDATRVVIQDKTRQDVRQLESILGRDLREYWFE